MNNFIILLKILTSNVKYFYISGKLRVLKFMQNSPKINKIVQGDAIKVLKQCKPDYFNLTVFSPPYDALRDYNGFSLSLHNLGEALFRVTKPGGLVVLVIQDQTKGGHKSLTSFRTIVDWCDNIGFGLWECSIYNRHGKEGAWWSKRLRVDHEYMPIFIKGDKPEYFNKEPLKIPCKHAGKFMMGGANRNKDNKTIESSKIIINNTKCPGTVWNLSNGGDKVQMKRDHPATYPDQIPYRFIQLFCPPNGIVLDPMVGSGSTAIAAKILGRKYLGIDISPEYCKLARNRLKYNQTNLVENFHNIIPLRKNKQSRKTNEDIEKQQRKKAA